MHFDREQNMKFKKLVIVGMVGCLLAAQTQNQCHAQVQVMTLPPAVETVVSTAVPGVFVSLMIVAGAITVAETVSEPLENYEVGLKQWRGAESVSYYYPDGLYEPHGSQTILYYSYNPDTGTESFQNVQKIWNIENGVYYSDQAVYYTPFPYSADNEQVNQTWPAEGGPGTFTETQSYFGSVDYFYCKRNGSAWFGRPVRVHVTGNTWQPFFTQIRDLWQIINGDYSHNQWLFVPKNSYAVFTPNRVVNSTLGFGHATTAYEIF